MEAIMYVCDTVLIMLTGWIDSYSRKIIHNTHHTPTFLLKWPQIKKNQKKLLQNTSLAGYCTQDHTSHKPGWCDTGTVHYVQ